MFKKKKLRIAIGILILTVSPIISQGATPVNSVAKPLKGIIINEVIAVNKFTTKNDVELNTTHYTIKIANKGGEIINFFHRDKKHPEKDNVDLTGKKPFLFQIYTSSLSLNSMRNANFTFQKKEDSDKITILATTSAIAKSESKNYAIVIRKIFTFYKSLHYWKFDWEIINKTNENLSFEKLFFIPLTGIGPKVKDASSRDKRSIYNFYYTNESFEKKSIGSSGGFFACFGGGKNKAKDENAKGNIDFFGTSSRFMLLALQPEGKSKGLTIFSEQNELHLELAGLNTAKYASAKSSFIVYTGPKVKEYVNVGKEKKAIFPELKNLHPELTKAFDFGITAPVRDAIVTILQWIHILIPNYGIGIIIFAILFKLLFWPLNQKQADSMKKMQGLQPLLKEINAKYKDKPQEKQKRTMEIYKKHKVNPAAGCLPMVIQLPIFIALYSAFSDAYELWKSPFILGWINDLSKPDTIYIFAKSLPLIGGFHLNILPLAMTASQFLQSKLTMVSGDSSQQKMMQFMPLMMLFFFWSMPSGVVLYWTIQNLLSIAQQMYTNKTKKVES